MISKRKKNRERKENSWSGLRTKDSLSNAKFSKPQISNFQFKIFIPEFKIPHSKFQVAKLQISSFKISSCKISKFQVSKFQDARFQRSKFQIPNFKFQTLSFKFQVSSFTKKKKKNFQGTTKIHQGLRANEKILSKSGRNKWKSHISKNIGTTTHSSFKV